MDPKIWSNLPPDIIERIAHFADIDTRRAMGVGPRRLVLPDLDIIRVSNPFFEFNNWRSRFIELRNARLYIGQVETSWQFGTNDFMMTRSYSFCQADGRVTVYELLKKEHSRHPDFNEDGSFKRSRPFDLYAAIASRHSQQEN